MRLFGLTDEQRLEFEQATGIKTETAQLIIDSAIQQTQARLDQSLKEIQTVIGPHGSVTRLQAGGVNITSNGVSIYTDGVLKTTIDREGNLIVGSNIDDPSFTSLCAFVNEQTYNNEVMGAGDLLIGDNSAANLKYDASEGQLQFRNGTTINVYVDTDGKVYAGGGGVILDDEGVTILKGAHSADIADVSAVKWLTAGGVLSAYIADQNISTVEDLLSMRKTRADGETQTSSKIRLHLKNEDAGHSNSGAAITLYGDATDTRIRMQIGQVGGNLYNAFTAIQTGSNTGNIILNADQIDMDTQVRGGTDANLIIADAGLDAVGIGGSSPAYKLDVNGDINARQGGTLRIAGNDIMNGWIPQGQYTWTRTGNYTFTVSGDVTTAYRKGTKIRYKDGGSYEYGIIKSSSYSSPNTTVTLITNTDYAMAAATITDKYISYIENPEGFPDYFNYTPTLAAAGGSITSYTVTSAVFWTVKSAVNFAVYCTITNQGTGAGDLFVSLPSAPIANGGFSAAGFENGVTGKMLIAAISNALGGLAICHLYDNTTLIVNNYAPWVSGVYLMA